MEQLRQKDFKRLLEFLRGCYAARDPDGFAAKVLSEIPKLIRSDITAYNELNLSRNRLRYFLDRAGADPPGGQPALQAFMHEHPVIVHYRRRPDSRPLLLSDFVTQRQYHRLGLYNEFFGQANPPVEDLMSTIFYLRPRLELALVLCRQERSFTERDRLLMNLLRPHLMQAYLNADAFDQIGKQLAQANHALEILDQGIIILGRDGRIRLITERARKWLAEYFGRLLGTAACLPEELQRWVKHHASSLDAEDAVPLPRKPLVRERQEKRLIIRLVSESGQNLLLLEEQRMGLEPEALESLGLSRREAEVLALVALGKSNTEIAALLDMKPKTVEKHLERIFQKLGVENRVAAAMRAINHMTRKGEL